MAPSLPYILSALFLATSIFLLPVQSQLQVGFYSRVCPRAEGIVRNTVQQAVYQNPDNAPGLLRMHFHDCFVQGCDGSILIDGANAEKASPPNLSVHGYEVIDAAKSRLEAVCPGTVSCADVLAFAARDSVVLTGGPFWQVPAGRLDGTVSQKSDPTKFLPPPSANVAQLTQLFGAQGLSQDEMITLSGAHTIGVSHCTSFINRLYNFSAATPLDPSLNSFFAQRLQQLCPQGNPNPNTVVPMDALSSRTFDNTYYNNLKSGRGLFTSDESLFTDASTQNTVVRNSLNNFQWGRKFTQAMIRMSSIGVKTGTQGQIRTNCRVVNP